MSDEKSAPIEPPRIKRLARERILTFANFLGQHERILNVLSTTVTAIFTVVLGTSTVFLWKETKDLRDFAQEQSAEMKESIAEAARAAKAMEHMATAAEASAKVADESLAINKKASVQQLRAYLTVSFGNVAKQDVTTNRRFAVSLNIQNVGNTPAYKVVHNIHVDVMPFPLSPALARDFQFPAFVVNPSSNALGPHQSFFITGIADRIYSEDEVREVASGSNKRLYVYGTVKYEDTFGVTRETNFCQAVVWLKDDSFSSLNTYMHNDAN